MDIERRTKIDRRKGREYIVSFDPEPRTSGVAFFNIYYVASNVHYQPDQRIEPMRREQALKGKEVTDEG